MKLKAATKLFSNTSILVVGAAIGFLTSGMAARVLGPEDFGFAAYILNISGLMSILCSFGYQFRFAQSQRNFRINANELHKASSLSFITLILLMPFVIFTFNDASINQWMLVFVFLHSIFFILVEQLYYYYNSTGEQFKAVFNRSFIAKILPFCFILCVIFFGLELQAQTFIGVLIIGLAAVIFLNLKKFSWCFPNFEYLKTIRTFYFVQLLYFIPSFGLRLLYVEIASLTALAYLTLGIMFSQVINLFSSSICNQLAPRFRIALQNNNLNELKELLQKSAFYPSLMMVPFLIIFAFNFEYILSFLGENYVADAASLIILAIVLGAFFNTITGATGTILMLSNYANLEVITGILKAIITLLTFFLLYIDFSSLSVPVALAVGEVSANLMKLLLVHKKFKISPWSLQQTLLIILVILFMLIGSNKIQEFYFTDLLQLVSNLILSFFVVAGALIINERVK